LEARSNFPLSSVQEVIWHDQLLNPDSPVYVIGALIRLDGRIDPGHLRTSVSAVAAGSDALRLVLSEEDGEPRQGILPAVDVRLPISRFSDGGDEEALDFLRSRFRQSFELFGKPLWRVDLVQVGACRWYLLASFHHLVTDGFGVGLFIRQVADHYTRLIRGEGGTAEEWPSYTKFLAEDERYLASTRAQKDQDFWRARLSPPPAPLPLARSPSGGVEVAHASGQVLWCIERAELIRMAAAASAHGLSHSHYMMALLGATLVRIYDVDEIVLGVPVHNRSTAGFKQTQGLFASIIPVRVPVDRAATIVELMHSISAELRGCYRHQRLPISHVNRGAGLAHTGRQAFDVMMSFEGFAADVTFGEVRPRVEAMQNGFTRTPLSVYVRDYHPAGQVVVELSFDTTLFDQPQIETLRTRLSSISRSILDDPTLQIGRIDVLGADERRKILEEWNDTAREWPDSRDLPRLFEAQAESTPNATALFDDARSLTYRELNEQANRLAHLLRLQGVGPETLVGVCLPRTPQLLVALLAVMKSGGAYVPLDPTYPRRRLDFIARDSELKLVITHTALQPALPATAALHLCLDQLHGSLAIQATDNPSLPDRPDRLAYVLYTSGSTGQPKGVEITHVALANLLRAMREEPGCDQNDTLLAITTVSFDIAGLELFLPLICGASVALASAEVAGDAGLLMAFFERHRPSLMQATPATWRALIDAGWSGTPGLKAMCGGESLSRDLAAALLNRCGSLWNLYGPTETTIWSSAMRIDKGEHVTIGRPIANTTFYVLDRAMQPVPLGAQGELYIGGSGLARGYRNSPDLTSSRFVAHPFSRNPDDRLYRTGDLVRRMPDGQLMFLGRLDQQVKIRGFRVEAGEIETLLRSHPLIQDAVVLAREDSSGTHRLMAWYSHGPEPAPPARELRGLLEAHLPHYMIPATFVPVARLPLTPNGKVDRTALPEPRGDSRPESRVQPRSQIERILTDIWRDVLQTSDFGVHDNFFLLGGHSLLATQTAARIRRDLGVSLPLRALFEHATIEELGRRIEREPAHSRDAGKLYDEPIEIQSRSHALPLSFSQQRMWFVQQREPTGTAYNMPFAVRLTGSIDRTALARALELLVERHEAFRTSFSIVQGRPMQLIAPHVQFETRAIDLRKMAPDERRGETERLLREEALQPFDLSIAPLFRTLLVQIDEQEHVLLWLVHHTIGDLWSASILANELKTLYDALIRGEEPRLPSLAIEYGDFAVWQTRHWSGERLQAQLSYWRAKLHDLPPLALPADRSRPAQPSTRGSRVVAKLEPRTISAIKQWSAEAGATPFMMLLACFKLLLFRQCNQEDIAVGTPVANRTRVETEQLVGTLVNTLVLRTDLSGDPTFAQLLKRVSANALDAFEHQDLPFERLVEELVRGRDSSQSPIVQVLFNVQNAPMRDLALPGVTVQPFDFDRGSAQFDLSMTVDTEITGLVHLEYSTELFDDETVKRMLERFLSLVDQVVADPDRPLHAYRLVGQDEERKLLRDWNLTQSEYPQGHRVDQLISAQACSTPDAMAVAMGNEHKTYLQLDAAANRLAHFLIGAGVTRGDRVGIFLERSVEMLVSLLAVMKAGATYVPLDPAFPADRLRFMAEDAELAAVVTRAEVLAQLPGLTGTPICLDSISRELALQPETAPSAIGDPMALAYVLYTSGSTGKPKGVEIPHRALTNFLCAMRELLGVSAHDRLLAVTTLSFDIAGLELYLPLICGARVVIASRAEASDGRLLIQKLKQCQATIMQATPTTWRMLIESGWRGSRHLSALCGGEALPADLAEKLLDRCKSLWNLYGPTETTIWSTASHIEKDSPITIGRPIRNTSLYILDSHKMPVPVGVAGELHIGGHGVARGYRNRPELTAERFIANPFSESADDRLYRTGDLARYLPDGRILHLGRLDFQVKIRGFRIELGEIEVALGAHPQIAQAVVATKNDPHGQAQLVAYLIRHGLETPAAGELRSTLRNQLPEYMIPAHFVWLDSFPQTANRKIDINALPAPSAGHPASFTAPVAPRGRLEVQLTALWRQVLGDDTIGVRDNFFDHGGHSLKAVQLLSQIEQIAGRTLPLATLFQAPTVEELARVLRRSNWEPPWRSLVAIQPGGGGIPIFAIPGVGGNVLMFAKLARLMGEGQSFYGLQARGLDSVEEPFTSIATMAGHYVREIRSVRPKGPYFLAGACTGGVAAYEVASRLRAEGEHVSLMLLESWHPSSARRPLFSGKLLAPLRFVWSRLLAYGLFLAHASPRKWSEFFVAKAKLGGKLFRQLSKETLASTGYYRDRVTEATWHAVSRYRPRPIPGSLVHVIAAKRVIAANVVDSRRAWDHLAGDGAKVHFIDAQDSGQLFASPHVEKLAAVMREYHEELSR
jgi:amino acid adenylation domain-containing protein